MGIRLYPNTKNVRNLEILAGVPEGTHAKLKEIEDRIDVSGAVDFRDSQKREEALYKELYAPGNGDINTLHGFLLFGWGRFTVPADVEAKDPIGGSFNDEATAKRVLVANGIFADFKVYEGLHYC